MLVKAIGQRSVNQFALHSGISSAHISRLGRALLEAPPSPQTIKKISDAAHNEITYDQLMRAAGYMAEDLKVAENQTNYSAANFKILPVLGIIRAGDPLFAEENIIGYESANADDLKGVEHFYLRVTGDSMIGSRIQEGDLVLVRKQDDVDSGQIAVVMIDSNEATIKKVYKQDGQLLLQADNPKYAPIVVKGEDVRIIGIVVKVEFKVGS